MKKIVSFILYYLMKMALWFRYSVTVKGLDNLNPTTLKKSGGVLFLPNHPTVFADPTLNVLAVHKKFPIRPMIVEYMYYLPIVNGAMRLMNALPVPNFVASSNSLKKRKVDQVLEQVIDGLKKGDNFLIYPAGKVKSTSLESVSGSGVPHIIHSAPEANIVLVRIKGLWGSSFSRAATGKHVPMFATAFQGFKIALKNLIFFSPRRKVIIELVPAPADFPYQGSRLEINRYLENWYNQPDGLSETNPNQPGDSLCLVPYSIWNRKLPTFETKVVKEAPINLDSIPAAIQQKVKEKISQITEIPVDQIKPGQSLSTDLGLDSLDVAEMIAFLDDEYAVRGVLVSDITSVSKVMALAAKQIKVKEETSEETVNLSKWRLPVEKKRVSIPEGQTMPEVFLRTCDIKKNALACGDARAGVITYAQAKMRVLLLAEYIRQLPGTQIGILLPASVAAYLTTLACQMAGKIPVMINWTIGPRHLESVQALTHLEVVLSSWAFLDRLENIEFNGLEDKMVLLEDVRFKFTLKDKIRALYRSKFSTESLLKTFNISNVSENDTAVQLFTSGTENMPKGVPLSHKNILSNLRSSLNAIELYTTDVLLGILPPFHAFGFTVSGFAPLLAGCKAAYYPDPTDGRGLARSVHQWEATIICGAPTFLKGMLKATRTGELKTLRLLITGAEKAPPELFELAKKYTSAQIIEGYGITECSPVLTMNPTGDSTKGVGAPVPDVVVCIVDLATHEPLPVGQQGLVLVRGPNIFNGYLNKDVSSPFLMVQGQFWYSTGDLGHLDSEGNLILSGRLKRFVKIGGEMISLSALETAFLHTLSEKIKQALPEEGPTLAVCAKEETGEKTRLFLFTSFALSAEEANKALRESGFSNLVRISQVYQMPAIPIMGTGKVNYRELESQLK